VPVIVMGKNFGQSSDGSMVTFGNVIAEVKRWVPEEIVVVVPPEVKAGTVNVVVKVATAKSNAQPFKVASAATPTKKTTCTQGATIPLGVLTGSDADLLAQTLGSIFNDTFIVAACADSNSSGQPAAPAASAGDSSTSSKNTLRVKKGSLSSTPKCAIDAARCAFDGLEASLDRDNFKGVLNSNYVIHVHGFASSLAMAFPHPTPDINVEQANDGRGGKSNSEDYLILVPSSAVLGQTAALKTLGQHAAGIKHDFELLYKYGPPYTPPAPERSCPADANPVIKSALCIAENTVILSVLNPRDVALHAQHLFKTHVKRPVPIYPLNHAVALLPPDYAEDQSVAAVEQYELYQQNGQQTQVITGLQSASPGASSTAPAAPVTTTTTTVKTPVSAASKGNTPSDSGSATAASATTSISTSTSTTTTPPAAGASVPTQAAPSPNVTATPSSAPSPASLAAAQTQPASPSWSIDNIVRLYDYRDAPGIAAAINAMVPGGRPIVQALSDNNANDLIEVLPSAAQQGGYNLGDIERAISLLDLPRPQLSLQVWSYQISARVKNPVEPYRDHKVKCPKKKDSANLCNNYDDNDDARAALENLNSTVDEANRSMTRALESGMDAIVQDALLKAQPIPICHPASSIGHPDTLVRLIQERNQECDSKTRANDPFFEEDFREYLTMKYHDCIGRDHYCIGYYNALDYPSEGSGHVTSASLGRLILFLAAANFTEAQRLAVDDGDRGQKDRAGRIIKNMRIALICSPADATCPHICPTNCPRRASRVYFTRLSEQLSRVAESGNLRILRAAFLDFFFNYKWTINYPNDFVPYDLRRSAHTLDDLLQPIVNAFNGDIDEYVQDQLDNPNLIPKTSRAGLISQGMVQVAALSGTPAMVSGQISDYFDITKTPSLSEVAQNLLAPSGSSTSGGAPGLQGLISTNPYVVGGEALAAMLAPQKLTAQLTKGVTLIVTPTSLDTASSAELAVSLSVNEPDGGPQSVNSTTATQDLLDRVSSHLVTDTVRVQSLKLFDLSTVAMEITHQQTPTCLPLAYDGFWRAASYVAAVPFSVPCAVWRSTFGSMPVAGRLFEWPRPPVTVDNRSVAIIRATVVPTAMDLGEALDFESDRVYDPITNLTESLSSVGQLGWKARQFHRLMMRCILNSGTEGCPARLSETHDDLRKPSTN
jgi:IPT/TIG domain